MSSDLCDKTIIEKQFSESRHFWKYSNQIIIKKTYISLKKKKILLNPIRLVMSYLPALCLHANPIFCQLKIHLSHILLAAQTFCRKTQACLEVIIQDHNLTLVQWFWHKCNNLPECSLPHPTLSRASLFSIYLPSLIYCFFLCRVPAIRAIFCNILYST